MKTIEVSDEVHAALQRLATRFGRPPGEILASLLEAPTASVESSDSMAAFILGPVFRGAGNESEKYLSLLSWIAGHHEAEFGEFIRAHTSGSRYLGLSQEEILETCRRNHARQIDGTQYWAIMNLDAEMRRSFLVRLLDFIGYREEVIAFASATLAANADAKRQAA